MSRRAGGAERGTVWAANGLRLLLASFVVLFQELSLIRWLPTQVRVVAYFPNLILISAFLGLGVGCLRAGRRSLIWMWPASLIALVAVAHVMSGVVFTENAAAEHLWLLYFDLPDDAPVINDVRFPLIVMFLLSMVSFIPLGQFVAERLQEFRVRSIPLWGYCWDIAGSLIGVIVFALMSFAGTFPVTWFALFMTAGLLFFVGRGARTVGYLAVAFVVVAAVYATDSAHHYSPYYAIKEQRESNGRLALLTNGSMHQYAVKVTNDSVPEDDWERSVRDGYHIPYRMLPAPPRRVLILGAGSGNDVSVALDEGAAQVDAVEIDPVILAVGKSLHPDRPYDSARVRVINSDARLFLNQTRDTYDLIVFGTLDSLIRLSALSSVRLDNFVYTMECLRAARERLAPGGGVALYFSVRTEYIHWRLIGMLAEVFGRPPVVVDGFHNLFNRIYLGGAAFENARHPEAHKVRAKFVEQIRRRVDFPVDDWPYLYLSRRSVSPFYLLMIALFGLIAVAAVSLASHEMRSSLAQRRRIDVEMFCFGLAFLLLETKSVTEINLIWGATWLTSAVVFGAILLMILTATVLTQLRPMPWSAGVIGLFIALLVGYAVPVRWLLVSSTTAKLLLSVLFVGTPIFFAAVCFALLFAAREESDLAFGWNLLGAVAGGLLEFSSMALGLKALSLLALVSYLIAILFRERNEASTAHVT